VMKAVKKNAGDGGDELRLEHFAQDDHFRQGNGGDRNHHRQHSVKG